MFKPRDGLNVGCEEDIDVETVHRCIDVQLVGVDEEPPRDNTFVRYGEFWSGLFKAWTPDEVGGPALEVLTIV